MSRARGSLVAATGAVCLAGVALVTLAAKTSDRAAASPIATDGIWRWMLLVGVVAAFCGYVLAVFGPLPARRTCVALAVAIQLTPLAGPLLLSTDVYSYWAYGRVGTVHGENPYADPPGTHPDDPAVVRMGADWKDDPIVYGPLFAATAEGVAALAGDDADVAQTAFRALAALAMVVLVLAVARGSSTSLPVVVAGWNPLLALHAAGGGTTTSR